MADTALLILLGSALSIGFIHTLIGPDHYLPFIVMSRARNWTTRRTLFVTFVCGLGHVMSSVLIGTVGVGLGSALGSLRAVEGIRSDIASYALIAFGTVYAVWGLWKGRKGHGHVHLHNGKHLDMSNARSVTFWTLFLIFVLGPCEPLIPLLMFPAVSHNWYGVALVTAVFGVATVGTMTAIVYFAVKGLANINLRFMERYVHAAAGAIIAISGMAIRVFGI
jgi:nickel/cobalt exporter